MTSQHMPVSNMTSQQLPVSHYHMLASLLVDQVDAF
jgi:hypothetical protein